MSGATDIGVIIVPTLARCGPLRPAFPVSKSGPCLPAYARFASAHNGVKLSLVPRPGAIGTLAHCAISKSGVSLVPQMAVSKSAEQGRRMKRIVMPIVFPMTSRAVAYEVATIAQRFKSEIVLLHIVTPPGHVPGLPMHEHNLSERDRHVESIRQAQQDLDQALLPEFAGMTVRRLLHKGDAAHEIVRTAREEDADLIAMGTHSQGALYSLLLGSTTAKVLHQ